jgi:hypothetical protein
LPEVSKWLLEKGLAQHRIESFQSQKDARDRDGFLSLSEEMQQELNRENRYATQRRWLSDAVNNSSACL